MDGGLFDVEAVFDQYSGRGSKPHPPDLLLKLALYEHCRGRTKPIQWHRDLTKDLNVRWLTFGMKVAQKTLYNFRDRLAPLLAGWHKQVLEVAVAEQLVDGRQASIDGTAVAANASRRKLGNMQQVDERLKQLQQAMTPLPETPLPETPPPETPPPEVPSPETASLDSAEAARAPDWMAKTDAGKSEQYARYSQAKQRLSELHALRKVLQASSLPFNFDVKT